MVGVQRQRSLFPQFYPDSVGVHTPRQSNPIHEAKPVHPDPQQMSLFAPEGDDLELRQAEIEERLASVTVFHQGTYPSPSDQSHDEEILLKLKKQAILGKYLPMLIEELKISLCHSVGLEEERVATAIDHVKSKREDLKKTFEPTSTIRVNYTTYKPGSILSLRTRGATNLALALDPNARDKTFTDVELKAFESNPALAAREEQFKKGGPCINFEGDYVTSNFRKPMGSMHALQFIEELDKNLDYFLKTRPDLLYNYLLTARKAIEKVHSKYESDLKAEEKTAKLAKTDQAGPPKSSKGGSNRKASASWQSMASGETRDWQQRACKDD